MHIAYISNLWLYKFLKQCIYLMSLMPYFFHNFLSFILYSKNCNSKFSVNLIKLLISITEYEFQLCFSTFIQMIGFFSWWILCCFIKRLISSSLTLRKLPKFYDFFHGEWDVSSSLKISHMCYICFVALLYELSNV